MTTIVTPKSKVLPAKKLDLAPFIAELIANLGDSIGDMVITVAITGITLVYMGQIIPPVYAQTIPGLYIAGMLVQLFIRIVHRFDDSYTTDEIGRQLARFEDEINERLDNLAQQ